MKVEFWQTVMSSHIVVARACKTVLWEQSLPRAGEYVAGLDFLNDAQELPVQKVLHDARKQSCCIELPPFNLAQMWMSYRELERAAAERGWTLEKQ